jgi:potassium-transporting ATPase ATP-binding subunit
VDPLAGPIDDDLCVEIHGRGSHDHHARKGAAGAVTAWVRDNGGVVPERTGQIVDGISAAGGTPLVVAERVGAAAPAVLGVVHLKDVVKHGMSERFEELRRMGIRTVMITATTR